MMIGRPSSVSCRNDFRFQIVGFFLFMYLFVASAGADGQRRLFHVIDFSSFIKSF